MVKANNHFVSHRVDIRNEKPALMAGFFGDGKEDVETRKPANGAGFRVFMKVWINAGSFQPSS